MRVRKRHALHAFLTQTVGIADENAGVTMEVLPFRGYLNLRGDAKDRDFAQTIANQLGQPLPLVANTFSAGAHRVYWLGPDEWLIVTEPGRESALAARLTEALAGRCSALTDLTGGQIAIGLSGPNARDALAKGCTLDFHPRVFKPGHCAQTVLGKASMLIGLSKSGHRFEIVVRRTFAEYAAWWLYRGAEEYGVRVGTVV